MESLFWVRRIRMIKIILKKMDWMNMTEDIVKD